MNSQSIYAYGNHRTKIQLTLQSDTFGKRKYVSLPESLSITTSFSARDLSTILNRDCITTKELKCQPYLASRAGLDQRLLVHPACRKTRLSQHGRTEEIGERRSCAKICTRKIPPFSNCQVLAAILQPFIMNVTPTYERHSFEQIVK